MLIGELKNALSHFPEAVKLLKIKLNLKTTVLRFYFSLRNAQVLEILHHENVCWLQCFKGILNIILNASSMQTLHSKPDQGSTK